MGGCGLSPSGGCGLSPSGGCGFRCSGVGLLIRHCCHLIDRWSFLYGGCGSPRGLFDGIQPIRLRRGPSLNGCGLPQISRCGFP